MTTILIKDARDLAQVIQRELQAIEQYAAHQPDLIILDWMLPNVDGLEVLRHIRRTSPVPVLMLTAREEKADRVIGLESSKLHNPSLADKIRTAGTNHLVRRRPA